MSSNFSSTFEKLRQSSPLKNSFIFNSPSSDKKFADIEDLLQEKPQDHILLNDNIFADENESILEEKEDHSMAEGSKIKNENDFCQNFKEKQNKNFGIQKKVFAIGSEFVSNPDVDKIQEELRKKMGIKEDVSINPLTPPPHKDEDFYKYIFDTNYSINHKSKKELSTTSDNIEFNFGSMKFKKESQKMISFNLNNISSQNKNNFFQNILHSNQQPLLLQSAKKTIQGQNLLNQNHLNLNQIGSFQNQEPRLFPLSSKRRAYKRKDFGSKCTTGLRRQSLIDLGILVEQAVTPNKKTTFVNLSKLFQQSPSLKNKQFNLFNFVQESMRYLGKDFKSENEINILKKNIEDKEMSIDENIELGKRPSDIFEESNYQTPLKSKKKLLDLNNSFNSSSHKISKMGNPNNVKEESKLKNKNIDEANLIDNTPSKNNSYLLNQKSMDFVKQCNFQETIKKVNIPLKNVNPLISNYKLDNLNTNKKLKINSKGCSCSKSNCSKNYCECHKNGLNCSSLCKCETCKNDKIFLSKEETRNLLNVNSRNNKKYSNTKKIAEINFEEREY